MKSGWGGWAVHWILKRMWLKVDLDLSSGPHRAVQQGRGCERGAMMLHKTHSHTALQILRFELGSMGWWVPVPRKRRHG